MKICVIGTGYVGLVVGACFAEMGNFVVCVDNDKEKLKKLNNGIIPIYEPGLEDLIKFNVSEKRLSFTSDLENAVQNSIVCFIAVGTPQGEDGSADMKYVYTVAEQIGKALNGYKVIVDKSTVPVGTAEKVTEIIRANAKEEFKNEFDVVSNPEFLKQGAAVEDSLKPDRIVIGSNSERATKIMYELYAAFLRTGNPIITMDVKSAEMTKYAANSFLAVKISYINEIANICEKVGANVDMVRLGMAADRRIGSQFLFPGLGYGGSCFPKDVKALLNTAKENGCEYHILKSADFINFKQREVFIKKIENYYNSSLKGKTFAVWGLAFKPNTNDMREAPSITIINALLEKGATIKAYDPKAMETAKIVFDNKIEYYNSSYEALENADALLLITEWNEFRRPDFNRVRDMLKDKIIFDGRNIYDKKILGSRGLNYIRI
ncbi:UDP-glucose/GDP-mannose dehydrogenase family protein [Brachyspira pilosicoli]|uniref:UDP-glucose 6-dehydrogenase n=1 Tax=Brachyspira pilosicoli TaxID=52584 RepID=A0AAJ6GF40_BRAPL|nr:UDP-glucose/GDP-mannose dehydrogenase family protein [Brachyspira pilosicoli]WIH89211.1 UDP-glucose/GDP-mannose dehydrogenase family protein [Brachyspira pilosicoli]WIH91506.1 UDP-glucose/GDP-mannose dehydrogenase family protein [Brachyspira pilosicoli]WIH93795.1 UDP-glucose/GDP-mannose dehydrogenase family protein [Brachyspira pilosicoli]